MIVLLSKHQTFSNNKTSYIINDNQGKRKSQQRAEKK
nr:MAG TPA: hypothetical protein [Caudoviricetes sp.]